MTKHTETTFTFMKVLPSVAARGDKRVIRKKCGGSLVGVVALRGTAEEQGRVT